MMVVHGHFLSSMQKKADAVGVGGIPRPFYSSLNTGELGSVGLGSLERHAKAGGTSRKQKIPHL